MGNKNGYATKNRFKSKIFERNKNKIGNTIKKHFVTHFVTPKSLYFQGFSVSL